MRPRRISSGHEGARGQVMPLFALFSVLLLVMAGLAVDAGFSYLSSDQVERAAAAAALAGVAYLPGEVDQGVQAALIEAARNGYSNPNDTTGTSCAGTYPCVLVSQPAGTTNQLEVTIKVEVPTTFLEVVGFGPHVVSRTATAEYLPPISLGQPGASQGSALSANCNGIGNTYCTSPTSGLGSGGSNFYFERTEGWGNPRSEGDPFEPTPNDEAVACGPSPNVSCKVNSPNFDYHQISPMEGTESWSSPSNTYMNYSGGSSYLISIPPGQSVDVQIYDPAFAPDENDQSSSEYTYHEDDSSFENADDTTDSNYSAMSYTVFSVSTLSTDTQDVPISQEVFYPYNATGLYNTGSYSYFWFPPTTGHQTTVTGQLPATYHEWISALDYTPANNNDKNLEKPTISCGCTELSNPASATTNAYYRLEVDTLQWNGAQVCASSSCDSTAPNTGTSGTTQSNGQSKAHKGYAVQLSVPGSTTECATGNECAGATISAMGDMTVYTPVEGSTATSFSIPLFSLGAAYAGQTIEVDIFDIGDVGGGNAYVGIQEPNDGPFADATSIVDLGNSLGTGGAAGVGSAWPNSSCNSSPLVDACFQTASGSGGTAIYNGQWVQLQIYVPPSYATAGYWDLVYQVASDATAGDTFAVQVGFLGAPDRLLP